MTVDMSELHGNEKIIICREGFNDSVVQSRLFDR